ncbi:hypothetical protein ACFV1L_10400 [Kitasatospora sp. NPDC059646]|uniref:hypothetical protein n=1 Tax=Kitasatospora sp. NPDC059646 TaxID=3346893 RepID=UPI00368644BD
MHTHMERQSWIIDQQREKLRMLIHHLARVREQRDAAGKEAIYNHAAYRQEQVARREADEARDVYRAEIRRLQDQVAEREYFHTWAPSRELPADVDREVKRRTEELEQRVYGLQAQLRAQARRYERQAGQAARALAFVDDVRAVHGWAFAGEEHQHRDRLKVVYGCLYEYWAAEREQRQYVPILHRREHGAS